MCRDHAHLVAFQFDLALDLGFCRGKGFDEGLKTEPRTCIVIECGLQEAVEDFLHLVAEPFDIAFPQIEMGTQPGIEFVHRQLFRQSPDQVELPCRLRPDRAGFSLSAPCQASVQQLSLAAMGKLEQLFLAEAEDRALEHAGKGKIVNGVDGEPSKRQQILHQNVVGEFQPVGSCRRQPPFLQLADHRPYETVAFADQDQDVAAADWPAVPR